MAGLEALDREAMRRAARRDDNEAIIVRALEQVGAAVQRMSESGCPDLLVSWRGVLTLIEVKLPLTARGFVQRGRHRSAGGEHDDMTPAQVKWWREWKGKPPVIVRTVTQALEAIGAVISDSSTVASIMRTVVSEEAQIEMIIRATGIDRAGAEQAIIDGKRSAKRTTATRR